MGAADDLLWKPMGLNRWRLDLGKGFFLHVHDDGVTMTANVKGPAGLLNMSKGGFRKFSTTVPWATTQMRAWLRRHQRDQQAIARATKGAKRVSTNNSHRSSR